jgi:hypothetical protein
LPSAGLSATFVAIWEGVVSTRTKRRIKVVLAVGSASFAVAALLFSLVGTQAIQGCGGSDASSCSSVCTQLRKCDFLGSQVSWSISGFNPSTSGSGSSALTCQDSCEQHKATSPKFNETLQCVVSAADNCKFVRTCLQTSGS